MFGKRSKMPEKIQSEKATIELTPKRESVTDNGASFDEVASCDDEIAVVACALAPDVLALLHGD
jgi:hypothetical protein